MEKRSTSNGRTADVSIQITTEMVDAALDVFWSRDLEDGAAEILIAVYEEMSRRAGVSTTRTSELYRRQSRETL